MRGLVGRVWWPAGAALAGAMLSVAAASTAHAQGRWVVVVTQAGEENDAAERAAELASMSLRDHGASVLDVDTVRGAVERSLGQRPTPVAPDVRRRLVAVSERVLEHVAFGRDAEALAEARPALQAAGDHLASIGADEDAHAALGNLCLYTVRALLHDQRPDEAEARALECVGLTPTLEPDPRIHAPEVRELVSRVRQSLGERPHGTLAIEAPSGCVAHVNGRPMGATPLELTLPPGSYDVQAVCGDPALARVRRVELPRAGRVEVRPPSLGSRLDARGGLTLTYDDPAARDELVERDAAAVAGLFGVGNVLVVAARPDGSIELLRLGVEAGEARRAASAALGSEVSSRGVDRAVTALFAGQSADAGDGTADEGPGAGGYLLGAAGLAGLATGWVLYATWIDLDEQVDVLDPDLTPNQFQDAEDDRDARGTLALIAGGAGSALLTAAVPLLLPRADGIPWWSWIAAAAGAGLLTYGIVHSVQDRQEVNANGVPKRTVPLGPLLAISSAPLLAIPVTYLLRSALGDGVSGGVEAHGGGGTLHLSARF